MSKQELLIDFCGLLAQLADNLAVLDPNTILAQNIKIVHKFIIDEPIKIISGFKLYVLKYKDMIYSKDENFFLNNSYKDEVKNNKGDMSEDFIMGQILNVKTIWKKLDSETKDSIFTYAIYLCQLTEKYFE